MLPDADKKKKLQQLRQKLSSWRDTSTSASSDVAPPPVSESSSDTSAAEKLRQRQARIQEWKNKRAQTAVPPAAATKLPLIKLSKRVHKAPPPTLSRKRPFQNDDEEEKEEDLSMSTRVPLQPTALPPENDDDEIDELDRFVNDLCHKPTIKDDPTPHELLSDEGILSGEEEEVDGNDDEDTQQDLLSARLNKVRNTTIELASIDHATQNYSPFRKEFYTPVAQVACLDAAAVEILRQSLGEITVKGKGCPTPVWEWLHLGLPAITMDLVELKLDYTKPSPIQAHALPAIMSGRDVIGIAQTGLGKTLAFVLPMIRQIKDQRPLDIGDGPIAVVMTPTRELAVQVHSQVMLFASCQNLAAACCYGGASIESQIAELKRGVHILVGTPGRIIDLLAANGGRIVNLRRTTYLVLDEADRMFDMGFEPQVAKVLLLVRPTRQTVMFSATFPRKMEKLARLALSNALEISVGGRSVVASEIEQEIKWFEVDEVPVNVDEHKLEYLRQVLTEFLGTNPTEKILVFVEKQVQADELVVKLLGWGLPCVAIHGGKDQLDRKHAIMEFLRGQSGIDILLATSIAARGLDVQKLNLVINFDAPSHMEDYVHRVGRTGRAGRAGRALTFLRSDQARAVSDVVRAMQLSGVAETSIDSRALEVALQFIQQAQSGNAQFALGFGGKGLSKLESARAAARDHVKQSLGIENDPVGANNDESPHSAPTVANQELQTMLPDFTVNAGGAPETSGPDRGNFHSRIMINDLPQRARWVVVNRESLSKIIENSGAAITSKGQYYAPGVPVPKPDNGAEIPQKLYLLVEGLEEGSVRRANNMLRDKMIEGLESELKESERGPSKRYKV